MLPYCIGFIDDALNYVNNFLLRPKQILPQSTELVECNEPPLTIADH